MNTRSESMPYVDVAVDTRLSDRRQTLTYRVPLALDAALEVGQLIWVPLRRALALGIVVERHQRPLPEGVEARDIHALVEPNFCLSPIHWQLAVWMAEETICSLFDAASVMLPPGVSSRAVEYLAPTQTVDDAKLEGLTPAQKRLIAYLQREGEVTLEQAQRAQRSSLTSLIPALEQRGLLTRVAKVRHRPPDAEVVHYQVRLAPDAQAPPARARRQADAFAWLSPRLRSRPSGAMPLESVIGMAGIERSTLRALAERGYIIIEPAEDLAPEPRAIGQRVTLTPEQSDAWEIIRAALHAGYGSGPVLLHGVTGSGKTEVYLRAVADVLRRGKSAIVLVPEIGLSGQIASRFGERFGRQALILHSALPDRERARNWQRAASGEALVVVGPRSALFAPLPDVGVIILDEEHDASYKQDGVPRYHARAVAARLAQLHGAPLILGSATPDIETWFASEHGRGQRIELRERVGQRVAGDDGTLVARVIPLPQAEIVDLRAELRTSHDGIFSRRLLDTISARLEVGEQVILFLNRRGASTMVQCRACGAVSQCPYCDIPLVYHRTLGRMVCHRCGHREPVPHRCHTCGRDAISYYGTGTQRVETEAQRLFPDARVLRWDQDALRGNVTHDALLGRVMRHEVDLIIGTQMVAKGLDLPSVTAVGVINADTWLHLPDIRAAERTFQMLTQVAGRAGRRAAGGQVIFQTYSPQHYAITSAARHDYAAFYREEIAFRKQHGYPPFKRLARLLVRHTDEARARQEAEEMTRRLEDLLLANPTLTGMDLIGPAPAFAARVRGQYGWQILLRGEHIVPTLADIHFHPGWVVDVDPVSLL